MLYQDLELTMGEFVPLCKALYSMSKDSQWGYGLDSGA